ncbi:alpha/beta fold hydrolase [Reyranella soli]|jgi:pimeloyl-ACP methyl ester carboxylesterase|nr:alpha/beta hydrolase [Reyranella soli]
MAKILFLPGAGASPDFWKPVGALLPADWSKEYFGWPGLGDQPHDPAIKGIDDLVRMVAAKMDGPVDLVAQSMGGGIATRLAIEQPRNVRRLVLTVTSAGIDMAGLGASDWRESYRKSFPHAMPWITESRAAALLPVEQIAAPTLLLWGDADPISPVAVGRHLEQRISGARLHVVRGGDHDLAQTHAAEIAPLIERHLA